MDEAHINEKINDVLQGNLREIVSEMTVDQILTNRKQMAVSVVENARPDLAKMGLEVRDLQRAGRQGRCGRHGPQPRRY